MSRALVVSIRLHDSRYHGLPEWPPSPARLFQALIAGAAVGSLSSGDRATLTWFESLGAPTIASPRATTGQRFTSYVPNNDLDAVGRDPSRVNEIRAGKRIRPLLFDGSSPVVYAWRLDSGEDKGHARAMCEIARRLYQFGRGVDMAWACAEVLDDGELEGRLSNYPGFVYRPSDHGGGLPLSCPLPGSLASLEARFTASCHRFRTEQQGKKARQLFTQAPRPRFVDVIYESPPSRRLYDLRRNDPGAPFVRWPLVRASRLTELLRDLAADRLRRALLHRAHDVDRFVVGRLSDAEDAIPTPLRVRIAPLPSIGHPHVDPGIRRVLVEVPAGCPLRPADVHWAFSGLDLVDRETGQDLDVILTPSEDDGMLAHYGVQDEKSHRVWRTVTPAVLPERARRRRIEPTAIAAEAKNGAERALEESRAAAAVLHALRHADIRARAERILVQREPFEGKGARVEKFALGTRFPKERLWHVEIGFDAPITGPLIIGDGRFLGLGVMAPVRHSHGVHTWTVESGLNETARPADVTTALRRAVMARVQYALGARMFLPRFFTGHESDGSRDQTVHRHLAFAFDAESSRLLVLAPHIIDRRPPTRAEVEHLCALDEALVGFRELRAGAAGLLMLRAGSIDMESDPLFAPSRVWESVTPYQVTRHAKHESAADSLGVDICAECLRTGLPRPLVLPREVRGVPGIGLVGQARLMFAAVRGPILLGRSSHLGGGFFRGETVSRDGADA